jgi:tetratricopeptide (TPR) repeat protein
VVSLYANLVAATVYERQGDLDNRKTALAQASKDADALESLLEDLPTSGWAVLNLYRYQEYIGENEKAFQSVRLATHKVKGPWPATYYALGLYRRGKLDEALNVLDRLEPGDVGAFQETLRMFILADLPGGDQRAMQVYASAVGRYRGTTPLFLNALLYRLGRKADAVAAYSRLRLPKALAGARGGSYGQLLRYNCGRMTAEELLGAAKDSQYHQCNAHFFIAMSLLADGDRAGARRHFQQCVRTRCFDFDACDWSRAFLDRMNQDPLWPRFGSPAEQAVPRLSAPRPLELEVTPRPPEKGRAGRPAKM